MLGPGGPCLNRDYPDGKRLAHRGGLKALKLDRGLFRQVVDWQSFRWLPTAVQQLSSLKAALS